MALGLLAGLASFALQGASAFAAQGAQRKAARQNKESATRAYQLNSADLAARSRQADEAAALDIFGLRQQGAASVSTAAASAGESGVEGSSVTALLNSYLNDTSNATAVVERNLGITQGELDRRQQAAGIEYRDRLNSVQAPSAGNLGLSLLGAGMQAAPNVLPYLRSGGKASALSRLGTATPAASLQLTRKY